MCFATALAPDFEITTVNSTREAEFALRKKRSKGGRRPPDARRQRHELLVRAREEYPHMQRILVTAI